MSMHETIEIALQAMLPPERREQVSILAYLIEKVSKGEISLEMAQNTINSDPKLSSGIQYLVGRSFQLQDSIISFGQDNQIGDHPS